MRRREQARPGWRRAPAIALALLLGSFGCRHQGAAWETNPAAHAQRQTSSEVAIELFVIGQPRASLATRAVAKELDRQLRATEAAGRTALILWLGLDLGPPGPERGGACPGAAAPSDEAFDETFDKPGLAELAEVVTRAQERGASSWGLPGPDAWRCKQRALEATSAPYRQTLAAVLRVEENGALELVSRCEEAACEVTAPERPPLIELVLLDLSPWVFPELGGDDLEQVVLAQQRSLLDALSAQPRAPRLLISPIPIESAGTRGLGGRMQRTSFRYLPEFVQEAIAGGMFVGAIGALERDLQLSVDVSNAIVRGDRSFIAQALFAIVAGSAGGAGHTLPTSRGHALLPDLWSEHPGFARLELSPGRARAHLHARVAGRWHHAAVELPLGPTPLPNLREPPTIQPCPNCDPHSGAADGQIFVPRKEGPR